MPTIFFTSDTHFGHANIVKYCNRPFANAAEMDAEMIRRWNSVVGPADDVYHLGDFAFGNRGFVRNIVSQLQGRKILIRGNHDRFKDRDYLEFGFYAVWKRFILNPSWGGVDLQLFLSHIPIDKEQFPMDAVFQICGHVHEKWFTKDDTHINVGVDQWNFKPASLAEVLYRAEANMTTPAGSGPARGGIE